MKFSVIIPAYNETKNIEKAISALQKQNIPRKDFEIIVINNNSTDGTYETAKKTNADKVISEKKQGTNLARERGFEESQGEIIAFLDADSEPPSDWLKRIEKNLSKKGVAATSGPFDYEFKNWKKELDSFYTQHVLPNLPKILYFIFKKKGGIIIGGNFAVWRWALLKINGLPPLEFFGDDAAIATVISREVGEVIFDPKMKVISSPRRFEKDGFFTLASKYAWNYFKIYFKKNQEN